VPLGPIRAALETASGRTGSASRTLPKSGGLLGLRSMTFHSFPHGPKVDQRLGLRPELSISRRGETEPELLSSCAERRDLGPDTDIPGYSSEACESGNEPASVFLRLRAPIVENINSGPVSPAFGYGAIRTEQIAPAIERLAPGDGQVRCGGISAHPRRVTIRKKMTVSASTSISRTKEVAAPSLMLKPRKARL
jgi:hypothetical protein